MVFIVGLSIATSSSEAAAGSFGPPIELPGASAGVVNSVSCTDATDCTAVGESQSEYGGTQEPGYATETDGTWGTYTATAAPPGGGGIFSGVSCVAAGDCTAVGQDADAEMIYATESNGTWSSIHQISPTGGSVTLYSGGSVSCAAAGDCTAVGVDGNQKPVYVTETNGTWGAMTEFSAPDFYTLEGVSCTAAGDCTAVGADASGDLCASGYAPIYATESNGTWGPVTALPCFDHSLGFSAVSCTDAADCTATISDDGEAYDTESDGTWGTGTQVSGSPGSLNAVSCTDATNCTAVGYDGNSAPSDATETDGTWSELTEIPSAVEGGQFFGVSCTGAACTAVGVENDTPIYASTVAKANPTVSVIDNTPGVLTGGDLVFTATVTGIGGVKPTGTAMWTVTGPGGATKSCPSPTGPTGSSNVVTYTCSISGALAGSYTAKAAYPGDSNYTSASGTDSTANVAKLMPMVSVIDDSLDGGGTVTFTATVAGAGGVTPTGPVMWSVKVPGGATKSCPSPTGPSGTSNVATYTCAVPRAEAGSATATYDPGDANYTSAQPVVDVPKVVPWTGPSATAPPYRQQTNYPLGLAGIVLAMGREDETLATSGMASNILATSNGSAWTVGPRSISPSLSKAPGLPSLVTVSPAGGGVTLDLGSGNLIAGKAALSANPPFSGPPNLKLLSVLQMAAGAHLEYGWLVIPVDKLSRTVTLTLTDVSPSSFSATLEDVKVGSLLLNKLALATVAAVVSVPIIIRAVPEIATAATEWLAAQAVSVAAGTIFNVLRTVLTPLLSRAAASLLAVIPTSLVGRASTLWNSLSSPSPTAAAAAARAASSPVEGAPASTADVLALRAADLHGLRAQRLRGALARAAQASLLTLPVSTTVRPLVATPRLPRGGRALTLLGGNLPGTKAQLVIAGPGYTAVRDVRITHGLAGGRIVLPRGRRAGRWYAGIIDYAGLRTSHGRVSGRAILEAASWVASR